MWITKSSFIIPLLAIICLAVVLGRVSYCVNPIKTEIYAPIGTNLVTLKDLAGLDPLWVDARSAEEYDKGHVSGAINLSMEDWNDEFGDFGSAWRPGKPVAVYCSGGPCRSSAEVAARLKQALPELKLFILKEGYPGYLKETGGK